MQNNVFVGQLLSLEARVLQDIGKLSEMFDFFECET